MYKLIVMLFLVACVSSSCMKLVMTVYGVKNPKPKTEEQLLKSLKKYEMDAGPQYSLTYEGFLKELGKAGSVNKVLIYDSTGYLIIQKDSNYCSSGIPAYIKNFRDTFLYIQDSSRFEDLSVHFTDLKGNTVKVDSNKNSIVIFWASYTGRLNRNISKVAHDTAFTMVNNTTQVMHVSLDLRDFWGDVDIQLCK